MDFKEFKKKYQKLRPEEYTHSVPPEPLVSICVQTYQHANFIKDCLEGILKQETKFSFEVLLGEDCSDDGTREICIKYAENYPHKIRLFLHHRENNINIGGQPTGRFNFIYNLFSARGKYIALCEGDDYWTDPHKLQKQVEFLKSNDDYGICMHNVQELNHTSSASKIIPGNKTDMELNIKDYILSNRTATCSILFEREKLGKLPFWFTEVNFGDLALILLILKNTNQKAKVFSNIMGVYNINQGSLHGSLLQDDHGLVIAYQQHLNFTKIISKKLLFQKSYRSVLLQKKITTYQILAELFARTGKIKEYVLSKVFQKYYSLKQSYKV